MALDPLNLADCMHANSAGFVLGWHFPWRKAGKNLSNLNRFLALPRVELLHIDEIITKLFGEIVTQLRQTGRPIQQDDMWIAALRKQYGYTLATADKDLEIIK